MSSTVMGASPIHRVGRNEPRFGRTWPNIDLLWPDATESGSKLAGPRPHSIKVVPVPAETVPNLPRIDRIWVDVHRSYPQLGSGRCVGKVDRVWLSLDAMRPMGGGTTITPERSMSKAGLSVCFSSALVEMERVHLHVLALFSPRWLRTVSAL